MWGHQIRFAAFRAARVAFEAFLGPRAVSWQRVLCFYFDQQGEQVVCRAARKSSVSLPAAPEVSQDREPRIFFGVEVTNLTGLIVAAGKETHTAAYHPPRRHSSRGVPSDPAEAARAAGGCLVRSRPVRRRRRGTIQRGLERG